MLTILVWTVLSEKKTFDLDSSLRFYRFLSLNTWINMTITKTTPACTNLDKAERQEGYVIGAEEWVEEHFFNSAVKVTLEFLNLTAYELRGWGTGVGRNVSRAGKLLSQVLAQEGQEVLWPKQRAVCPFLVGKATVILSRLCSALLVEAAQRHVHTKPKTERGEKNVFKWMPAIPMRMNGKY